MDELETLIKGMFGVNQDGAVDVTKVSVRFDLAAITGSVAGLNQCKTIYSRCQMPYSDLLNIIEDSTLGQSSPDMNNL
jgi:hypothetical protein